MDRDEYKYQALWVVLFKCYWFPISKIVNLIGPHVLYTGSWVERSGTSTFLHILTLCPAGKTRPGLHQRNSPEVSGDLQPHPAGRRLTRLVSRPFQLLMYLFNYRETNSCNNTAPRYEWVNHLFAENWSPESKIYISITPQSHSSRTLPSILVILINCTPRRLNMSYCWKIVHQ